MIKSIGKYRYVFAFLIFLSVGLTGEAFAQLPDIAPDFTDALENEEGGGLSAGIIQLFLLITVLSLAPGIAMMITCLPFMVIVFSFLRQAIGVQQAPPNMMIMSLAMFLTFFVMEPVFKQSWAEGVKPLMDGNITQEMAFEKAIDPFKAFMENRVEPDTIARIAAALPERQFDLEGDKPLSLLITSFMLSEIKHAFQIGFVIFLPFLIIDLIVASILMAMGMMMVPPAIVSLPFKLAFFVMADGWMKITEALLRGYVG